MAGFFFTLRSKKIEQQALMVNSCGGTLKGINNAVIKVERTHFKPFLAMK